MLSLWLENLAAYSLQLGVVLMAGGLALRLFGLRMPNWRLLCWQILLVSGLTLPLLGPWDAVNGGVSVQVSSRVTPRQPPQRGTGATWLRFSQAAAAILLAGTALRLGIFGLGLFRLRRYRQRSYTEPQLAHAAQARLGVRATIAISDEVPCPVTFGFLRPIILLPPRWRENQVVLYHELIHVRRRDWLCMAGEELVRAVWWFHPLVWYAIAQIQLAREQVVDLEVVKLTQSREQYLETLLAIAAARSGLDLAPAPLFLRKRHLRKRVASLMKEVHMSRIRLSFSLAGLAALTIAGGWVAVRAFPLQAAQQEAPQLNGRAVPKVIYKAPIEYPAELKGSGLEGEVGIKIRIGQDGLVSDTYVESGPYEFREAALKSVRQWRFTTDGPLPVDAEITVRFKDTNAAQFVNAKPAPEQDDQPKRIRVGGNVQSTKLIHKVTPLYPREAKEARIQGAVRMNVVIAKDGTVKELELIDGPPELVESAMAAVRQWVYETTLLNGEPIEVATQVDVNYTLSK